MFSPWDIAISNLEPKEYVPTALDEIKAARTSAMIQDKEMMGEINRQAIVEYLREIGPAKSQKIADAVGISKETVNAHLRRLIQEEKVKRCGNGNKQFYELREGA